MRMDQEQKNKTKDIWDLAGQDKFDMIQESYFIDANYHRRVKIQYYDVSARSNYNFEKPFLYLLRKLTGFDDLMFE